jgi:gluconate 5-dehydrogenase
MSALFDLAGRTALITGAATEVGLAIAGALADAGARVVVNARDPLKAEAAVQYIGVYRARTCCFDITDDEAVVHSVDKLEKAGWPVDILVNNAGGSASAVLVSQIVSGRMITRGTSGKIITVGDNSVRALTQALAAEWARHRINVNALAAGSTGASAPDGELEQWVTPRDQTECRTRSDDLRGPAVFLASAASDHVNGQLLYVGGGSRSCA